METVLDAALSGFLVVFSWPNVLYPIIGTLISMVFALVPGVTGVAVMAVAIPLTIDWNPPAIMLLFGSLLGGATFMGSISAILLGIPGRNSNAATIIDGYPMARQGLGNTAIGCAALSSALGSTVGIALLVVAIPFLRELVVLVGPAEYLVLVIWGLATVATTLRGSPVKGLAMAGLGFLLAMIGTDPVTAEPRFTGGLHSLADGIGPVNVFLGLFAVTEGLHLLATGRRSVSGRLHAADLGGSVWRGMGSVLRHRFLFLRCSLIGTLIGALPGVGGTVASFVAYGHASQSAGRKGGRFGRGDIRGVIAPEAANDAKDGGSLIPTLSLGIPGSLGAAVLLGAMTLHGIAPGRELVTEHLGLVFVLIWSLFLANWMTSIVGIAMARPLTRVTTIPSHYLVPAVLSLTVFAAYLARYRIEDVLLTLLLGMFGLVCKRYDWPRVPFAIAVVLAPMFESNLHLAARLHALGQIDFWTRPTTIALGIVTFVTVTISFRRWIRGLAR